MQTASIIDRFEMCSSLESVLISQLKEEEKYYQSNLYLHSPKIVFVFKILQNPFIHDQKIHFWIVDANSFKIRPI